MRSYTAKTICPYDCPTTCGLLAETDGPTSSVSGVTRTTPPPRGLFAKKCATISARSTTRADC